MGSTDTGDSRSVASPTRVRGGHFSEMKGTFDHLEIELWAGKGVSKVTKPARSRVTVAPDSRGSIPSLDPPPLHLDPRLWARLEPIRRHAILRFFSGVGPSRVGWSGVGRGGAGRDGHGSG